MALPCSHACLLHQLWPKASQNPRRCLRPTSAYTVCCSSSNNSTGPSSSQKVSSPSLSSSNAGGQEMSAKERRKLRNERREEAKAAQEVPWREMVENRLLQKKKKIRGWEEDADINRCIGKGMQWWMIQATRKYEFQVADQIAVDFPLRFPGSEFEVFVPTVPVNIKLKDGSASKSRKKLYQGIVLLRCVLDRDICNMVKQIPRAYEFFGNLAGFSLQPIIMPAPVSNVNMENMFHKIRQAEEENEQFKEQCRKEAEEQLREKQRQDEVQQRREQECQSSKGLILEVGATVRVLSGPFMDFTGIVGELLPKVNKIKVVVAVFGNDTTIVLGEEAVVVEAAVPDQ